MITRGRHSYVSVLPTTSAWRVGLPKVLQQSTNKGCRAGGGGHGYEASGDVEAPLGPGMLGLYCRFQAERSKKNCDNGFPIDLGYFDHFCGTQFVWGGSRLERLILELEDWIPAGQVSAGAGTGAGAGAGGDWIRGKFKEVVLF